MPGLAKVVSGGQTGVDQAALRAARERGLEAGGWCPPGRACEAGVIPVEFALAETPRECSPAAPKVPRSLRTEWNVRDSDATLILAPGGAPEDAGTRFAARCARRYGRPVLACDPADPAAAAVVARWLSAAAIRTLHVAGPSEGRCPGIGEQAFRLLVRILGEAPRASS